MNILVLEPKAQSLRYSLCATEEQAIQEQQNLSELGTLMNTGSEWTDLLEETKERLVTIEAIVVRVRYGGHTFTEPTRVDPQVLDTLRKLTPQAPLHLPGTMTLIQSCQEVFSEIPMYLVFDTALFADMPARESLYAIPMQLADDMRFRRYGFHGLWHQAACRLAVQQSRQAMAQPARKIISVCLEPNPEIGALIGGKPVFVTGGITPMEGLPSETGCGDIDPGIVLALSKRTDWGPERINTILSKESGLLALAGRHVTIEALYADTNPEYDLARQVLDYKLMNACGAAVAAMGGVDAMVFSGRYNQSGKLLGKYLTEDLATTLSSPKNCIPFYLCEVPLAVSIARTVLPLLSS